MSHAYDETNICYYYPMTIRTLHIAAEPFEAIRAAEAKVCQLYNPEDEAALTVLGIEFKIIA